MSKYVPGQKLPTPTPILLYPCQNPDCDPGYDAHDNLHSENTLFYWNGKPHPDWLDYDEHVSNCEQGTSGSWRWFLLPRLPHPSGNPPKRRWPEIGRGFERVRRENEPVFSLWILGQVSLLWRMLGLWSGLFV